MIQRLLEMGFERVLVLDAEECGISDAKSVLLAVWAYEAEKEPKRTGGWIHPYYLVSQKAYMAAAEVAREMSDRGLRQRDEVRLKPILGRIPGVTLGRNTLSYMEGIGSRFHVQVLTTTEELPVTHHLMDAIQTLHCGECRKCMEVCPSHAIDEDGFHRERCLRNWMLMGKSVPEDLRGKMGNRFLGCDECQRHCPHNPKAEGETHDTLSLRELLVNTKGMTDSLRPVIGANVAIPNRVLSQACILAGCSGEKEWLEVLRGLLEHPSAGVVENAAWAVEQLKK